MSKDVIVGAPLGDYLSRAEGRFVGERGGPMAEVITSAPPKEIDIQRPIGFVPPRQLEHMRGIPLSVPVFILIDFRTTHPVGFKPPGQSNSQE